MANEGFNPNLSPSKAHNFELGWRFTTPQNKVEATIYAINTQNEILPYELVDFPDRDFYRNAGSTTRRGIELYWEHQRDPGNGWPPIIMPPSSLTTMF